MGPSGSVMNNIYTTMTESGNNLQADDFIVILVITIIFILLRYLFVQLFMFVHIVT